MTNSPLLPYANARLLTSHSTNVAMSGGRFQDSAPNRYLITAFLKRQQSSTTSTGSTAVPSRAQDGRLLVGGSGETYIYRGYALQYAVVPITYNLGGNSEPIGFTFRDITDLREEQPDWLLPSVTGQLQFGNEYKVSKFKLIRSSGVYGSDGVDDLVRNSINGLPIVLYGSEVMG